MTGFELDSARVVITGGAGDLGVAFGKAFLAEGAQVLLADMSEQKLVARADDIGAAHCTVDVTSAQSCMDMVQAAQDHLDGLDILVNSAALLFGLKRKPFWELEAEEWDRLYAVNVKGVWQASKALLPLLRASDKGAIVNIASSAAVNGSANWLHYTSSKGALLAMTRAMSKELGPLGIRANTVAPGLVMNDAGISVFGEDTAKHSAKSVPLGRGAQSEDIVGAVLYAASPRAGFMTGQTLLIDGGRDFV
ncbi:MAG: SDR family NAD(P)-dependent oxidoreductase [Granulosicoccus sp.]